MPIRKYKRVNIDGVVHKLIPPDGGWGCIVALATTIVYISTVVPMAGFGLVFHGFLRSVGDETSGATLTNGLFNTVSFFMGLVASVLLNKMSYRKVALLGSTFHLIGTCGTIFVTNLPQLILFLGIFQGMGFGLLLPASLSAFNLYFEKKLQLWISISQTGMVIGYMTMPPLAEWSMNYFGFRSSLLILMGLGLFNIPAALALQPVKWHMKKVPINIRDYDLESSQKDITGEDIHPKNINLLEENQIMHSSYDETFLQTKESTPKQKSSFWKTIVSSMSLFKDPRYLNICIGLALCFTADIAFYPIIPAILRNIGYVGPDIALMMSVYFGADLVARIGLSVCSAFLSYRSRVLFYWGSLLSAVFRTVWLLSNAFWWRISIMAVLGVLRCFIETMVSLVVSEEYPEQFPSAFSLYMFANGVTCLVYGPLLSFVKNYTHSDVMVCHALTAAFLISVTSWTIEMKFFKKKK